MEAQICGQQKDSSLKEYKLLSIFLTINLREFKNSNNIIKISGMKFRKHVSVSVWWNTLVYTKNEIKSPKMECSNSHTIHKVEV